jgi:AcrR family transcriptional regulator
VTVEKWTPERRMERTRTALVQAARQVFASRGFEGASLDEIAETAGYTRGAIYKHFANKEDLFFAVVEAFNTDILDSFAERLETDATTALDNRETAATWMRALAGHREMWALGLEYSLYEYRNPEVRQRSAQWRAQNRSTVAAFMEHHMALTGLTLKLPADTVAAILLAAADGFMQGARVDADTEALFATFLDLFLPTIIEDPHHEDAP